MARSFLEKGGFELELVLAFAWITLVMIVYLDNRNNRNHKK